MGQKIFSLFLLAALAVPAYAEVKDTAKKEVLSLQQAVLFALHHNPQLLTSINQRQLQRYDLINEQEAFRPQISIDGSVNYSSSTNDTLLVDPYNSSSINKSANIGPSLSWKLPLGTTISGNIGYNPSNQTSTSSLGNSESSNSSVSWSITLRQPLLQGFGTEVNEVKLHNAEDQQTIDTLTLEQTVINTIMQVTQDYYGVLEAEQKVFINKKNLAIDQQTLFNRQQLFKAGRISQSNLTQAELDISTQRLAVSQAEQDVTAQKQKLLETLGLSDSDSVQFDVDSSLDVKPIHPSYDTTYATALKNNRDLKIAKLNYRIGQRGLLSSEDSQRWQLDLEITRSHTNTNSYTPQAQYLYTNNLSNQTSVGLNLTIPLDQTQIHQQMLSAAMDEQNADISLASAKRTLKNSVTSTISTLESAWQQVITSQQQLTLSETNLKIARIKFQYGKIDAFTLSQQQNALIQAQIAIINAKINYITQVMEYQKLTGTLLATWGIHFSHE